MPNIEPYYTVREIAELFKIAECTASDWIVSGKFGDTLNDGKRHLVSESALLAFIERFFRFLPFRKTAADCTLSGIVFDIFFVQLLQDSFLTAQNPMNIRKRLDIHSVPSSCFSVFLAAQRARWRAASLAFARAFPSGLRLGAASRSTCRSHSRMDASSSCVQRIIRSSPAFFSWSRHRGVPVLRVREGSSPSVRRKPWP